jgi:hypothetical protein
MVTFAGMVNGLHIRISSHFYRECPSWDKRFLPSLPLDFYRRYPLLAKVGEDVIKGEGRGQRSASLPPLSLLGT